MASLFDDKTALFHFVAKTGNGIKGLVDSGISQVPELYIQPPSKRFAKIDESSSNDYFSSVPIDLSKLDGPEHDQVAETIVRAAETLGFFQVINHGVDLELLESLKDAAHRFFALPPDAKAVYLKGVSPNPLLGYFQDINHGVDLELLESLNDADHRFLALPPDAKAVYLKGVSPNPLVKYQTSFIPENEEVLQWRDYLSMFYTNDVDAHKYWPKECKVETLEFLKLSLKMVRRLFEILVENLGVKLEDSKMEALIGCQSISMNFYPPCPNPELTIGAARHSDLGILTVLLQDEIGGLHVKAVEEDIKAGTKEEWVEIRPILGALCINVGDSLQIMSNDRYKSAEHKVRTPTKQSRVSIPLFVYPRLTEKIGPLPELVECDGRPLYKEVVMEDFINTSLKQANDGKKYLDFAKIN